MDDGELMAAFEAGTLPAGEFSHAAHVRVAWWCLRQHGLAGALERLPAALRRFAARHGAAGKYHETVTVAYLLVIAGRLDAAPDDSWETFAAANPDLLARSPSVLERYYTEATLQSDRARRVFVMPDRVAAR